MYFDTIIVRSQCPAGCDRCVEVCPQKGADGSAAIRVRRDASGSGRVSLCNQCSVPECAASCPVGAITRNSQGVVEVDRELCTGCGSCEQACPFNAIYSDGADGPAYKCDYCSGEPRCVTSCPHGVLELKKGKPLVELLKEDLISPGMPFCAGCPVELAARFTLRILGRDTIIFGAPGCTLLACRAKLPYYGCLMTNIPSSMTGFSRYLLRRQSNTICVAFVGDGATADIGFQPLSGAAERGEKILYICYDNEGYMNTGTQRSSTTPQGAWTTTTQIGPQTQGKGSYPKYVPLMMALHGGVSYCATAAVSHLEDYAKKLLKSREAVRTGMAYIHLFTPCSTGWRAPIDEGINLSYMAVRTNYFPLWEHEQGCFRFTISGENPVPLEDFVRLQGRFAHFKENDMNLLKEMVAQRMSLLKKLTEGEPCPL